MDTTKGIRLEFSDGRPPMTFLGDVNDAMAGIGSRLWPLNLTGTPAAIQRLLAPPTLTQAEAERVKAHFLLPRERLLQIIGDAGRTPNVPDGGALTTLDATHGYQAPTDGTPAWVFDDRPGIRRLEKIKSPALPDYSELGGPEYGTIMPRRSNCFFS